MGWLGTWIGPAAARMVGGLALAVAACGMFGCGDGERQGEGIGGSAPSTLRDAPSGPPFDLGNVIRRVHFAYRPDGEGRFVGGHLTYGATVEGAELRLVPRPGPAVTETPDPVEASLGRAPATSGPAFEGPPLRIETVSATRGGHSLGGLAGPAAVDREGGVRIPRAGMVERIRNDEGGVEQSWELPEEPTGSGPLVVRVAARGLDLVARTATGLHFAQRSTDLGFRYGHAVLVDAAGRRTPIPARWRGGHIELRVPDGVLRRAAYPAVLDPVVSPEIAVDEPLVGPSLFAQGPPAVAHDGQRHLVVWYDNRAPASGSARDIYGARVAPDGTVLDPFGIPIAQAPHDARSPQVASVGDGWLVVWEDARNADTTGIDLYGARVASDGTVLDPGGIEVQTGAGDDVEPAVASDGSGYLVTFAQGSGGIRGVRLDAAGAVLDGASFPISGVQEGQRFPQVASNGSGYLVAWMDARDGGIAGDTDVYAARVGSDGTVLDPVGIPVAAETGSHQALPVVASADGGYAVAWQDQRNLSSNGWDVYAARVTADGAVSDPDGIPVAEGSADEMRPSIGADGNGYLVTWGDTRSGCGQPCDIYASRLGTDGAVADPGGIAVVDADGIQANSAVAGGDSGFLVVWQDGRDFASVQSEVFGARVGVDGVLQDPDGFRISGEANLQAFPQVATDGTRYLVVWHDFRDFGSTHLDVIAARVAADGTILDPSGIAVAAGPGGQAYPSVAWNGSSYLVAWTAQANGDPTAPDIRARRLGSDGGMLDIVPIDVAVAEAEQERPRVASNGSDFLVVWQDGRTVGTDWDVHGARVDAEGTVLDPAGFVLVDQPFNQLGQAVASDGDGYLVAWHDARDGIQFDLFAGRVSGAGQVMDPDGFAVAVADGGQLFPSMTFDGTDYFVAWHDGRLAGDGDFDMFGARVGTGGSVPDPDGIVVSAVTGSHQGNAAVAADPAGTVLVVWRDARNGAFDLRGARFRDGAALDGEAFAISDAPHGEGAPAVASQATESWLVAYNRPVHTPEEGVSTRLRVRLVSEGMGCAGDADCDDGDPCTADGCGSSGACASVPLGSCGQSCSADADCDDGLACNGSEICGADGTCVAGALSADGLACATGRICIAGTCEWARCGDGFLRLGEQCDDGNRTDGDGCDADCTFTCERDADCIDGDTCTRDRCVDHVCEHLPVCVDAGADGAAAADGGLADGAVPIGDGGMAPDGGASPRASHGGCGCSLPGAPPGDRGRWMGLLLWVLAAAFLGRRRRRTHAVERPRPEDRPR